MANWRFVTVSPSNSYDGLYGCNSIGLCFLMFDGRVSDNIVYPAMSGVQNFRTSVLFFLL